MDRKTDAKTDTHTCMEPVATTFLKGDDNYINLNYKTLVVVSFNTNIHMIHIIHNHDNIRSELK